MAMNLFLWLSIIWIAPLIYYMQKNEMKFKKNIVVGVTLPYEARDDEEVRQILEHFKVQLKWLNILLLLIALACIPVRDFGIMMTLYLVWIDVVVIAFNVPYVMCNKKLKELKIRRGWRKEQTETIVNLQTAGNPVQWISPVWFLLPFAVSLLPFLWERTFWGLYLIDAALALFSWFAYRVMFRRRSETIDDNLEIAEALTRIRRYNWGKIWMLSAWFAAMLNLVLSFTSDHFWLNMTLLLLLTGALTVLVMRVEFKVRKMQEVLTRDSGKGFYVDEDDHWIWGMIYYNPNDKKLLVNNRTGMNMSFNLARKSGKIIMFLTVMILLAMPLFGVWMIYEEHQPVRLMLCEDVLTASHTGTSYEISISGIEEIELLETRPKLFKISGTGFDSVCKGKFRARELGNVNTCLDPRTGPWLFVKTEDGGQYLIGSSMQGEAEKIFADTER